MFRRILRGDHENPAPYKRRQSALSEFYLYVLAVGLCGLEERTGLESHEAGHEIIRDLSNTNVEGIHVLVVGAALSGDFSSRPLIRAWS